MISDTVVKTFRRFVPEENIRLREPMSSHTTFRIGGEAECFIEIENEEQLKALQEYLRKLEMPYMVLGNGSNVLFSDLGYEGVILEIGSRMSDIRAEGNLLIVQAGALMAKAARYACEHALAGLEFISGIPGTMGGGVVMNAGAYGGELAQVVKSVRVLDREGNFLELDNQTMEFGYRTSAIRNGGFTVVEVRLELEPGDPEAINAAMEELAKKRREKQPLEYPSAGSTFKRPKGYFAGELIMKAGLRGYQLGGARVSDKHCGFVINAGNASSADVTELIQYIQEQVKEKFGVNLEPEVILVDG